MATFAKRGKKWFVQVRRQGVSRSKSFRLKAEAQAWADDLEHKIETGGRLDPANETLAAVMERYARDVSPTKRGARWEKIRLLSLGADDLAQYPIAAITPELCGQWRDRRLAAVSAGTVLREITLLSAVFEAARREWGLITVNPWRDTRKPKTPKARDRLISDNEIERILLALGYDEALPVTLLSHEVAVMFLLAIETGMRAGELIGLTWNAVDLDKQVAHLSKTKNDDARDVPLSLRAVELFRILIGVDPVKCFTVQPASRDALFRKARQYAGIEDLHFHDSRHLAVTRLAKKLDVLTLARMIGHRDLKSLMCYFNEPAADIAKKLG